MSKYFFCNVYITCHYLDRTVRSVIWKGHADRGLNLVSWERVPQPTKSGGLGVRLALSQKYLLVGKTHLGPVE